MAGQTNEFKGLFRKQGHGKVIAGPFQAVAAMALTGDLTIKLAAEIDRPSPAMNVHIADFGIPKDEQEVRVAILAACYVAAQGYDVYVGCRGGIGRTGTFLSCMAGVLLTKERNPVAFVRKHYIPSAVETDDQHQFIESFVRRNRDLGALCRTILYGEAKKRTPKRAQKRDRIVLRHADVAPIKAVAGS